MRGAVVLVLALVLGVVVREAAGLGLFFRTAWVHEVPPDTLDAWFALIARGREEGPSSPYYVETLALQNVACNQLDPIGPPCNASAPTHSKQAHGHSDLPFASLWYEDLDRLAPYFPLFDKVYVGTIWLDGWDMLNKSSNTAVAALQARVASEFLARYGNTTANLAWYITEEASLNEFGGSAAQDGVVDFLDKTLGALRSVRDLDVLWSPATTTPYGSYNASALEALRHGLENVFCRLEHPLRLHFQDFLGQSVRFRFPFAYNYSAAFTCEGDSVPYYRLLNSVAEQCPRLAEVQVNMEMFAERLSPAGERGENNGAMIITANPGEIHTRMACYARHGAEIGLSWALPHWYALHTFANATLFQPY